MDGYIGEVRLFAGNFAPRNWAFCEGQLLAISSNNALFSILGTTYGGDGRTSFGLPDCRGRSPLHPGTGPGLSTFQLGAKSGNETTTLLVSNLPAHNHTATIKASNQDGEESDPDGQYLGKNEDAEIYHDSSNVTMGANSVEVGNTGSNTAFSNRPPYIALNYIVCLVGLYPSRN